MFVILIRTLDGEYRGDPLVGPFDFSEHAEAYLMRHHWHHTDTERWLSENVHEMTFEATIHKLDRPDIYPEKDIGANI